MDNTLTKSLEKLMNEAKKLPPEAQLRMLWVMLNALACTLEQLKGYQEAGFGAVARYVEECTKVDDKALVTNAVVKNRLSEAIAELDKDLRGTTNE